MLVISLLKVLTYTILLTSCAVGQMVDLLSVDALCVKP
jgi:hypothetical protein